MIKRAEETNMSDEVAATGMKSPVSRRQVFALAGGAALLAACSSDAKKGTATTSVNTVRATTPTTDAPTTSTTELATTTTTVVAETSTTVAATTTTVPGVPVQPLTGLALDDPALLNRVALIVKVSNDPGARPQTGLNDADIVFEAWGAGPTRFATIWHSRDLDFVGPIRSCREQDVNLVGEFNKAVFACSGGNPGNIALLRSSDLLLITEGQGPGWELDPRKSRPHKTHANTALLRSNAGTDRTGPSQQFTYRPDGVDATLGDLMTGFDLQIQSVFVQWRYDFATNGYVRSQENKPHLLANGDRVTAQNVVICSLDYEPSHTDARSPDGVTTGSGPLVVFTGGRMVLGQWTRADRLSPFTLTSNDGVVVPLTPGRTFIELPNSGQGSFQGSDKFTPIT